MIGAKDLSLQHVRSRFEAFIREGRFRVKRRLVLCISLFLACAATLSAFSSASAGPVYVQDAHGSAKNATSVTLTLPKAPAAGDTVVVELAYTNSLNTGF